MPNDQARAPARPASPADISWPLPRPNRPLPAPPAPPPTPAPRHPKAARHRSGGVPTLPGRVPFLARIARPRLGCVGPVVPGGLGVLVVCCPARRVRNYPGGSGPPGGSGTSWGPGSTRKAISTPLFAGPGAGGAPGPAGEGQEPGGQGFPGRGRGGRFAGRGRAEATRPRWGSWGLWFQADRTYPGYLTGAVAPSTGACAPQAADGRAGRPGPRRRVTP